MKRGLPKVETEGLKSFIPQDEIFDWLEKTKDPTPERVREIIQRSLDKNRLEPEEMATLINADSPDLAEEIFEGARELKRAVCRISARRSRFEARFPWEPGITFSGPNASA